MVKVSHRQMWFDLTAGVTAEKIEQQSNGVLLALWNQLCSDQQFILILRKATTGDVRLVIISLIKDQDGAASWWGSRLI